MDYFERFVSNTHGGTSNQYYFEMDKGEVRTGRVFYKIAVGGTYPYSLLFSNTLDSSFRKGQKNQPCDAWEILNIGVARWPSDAFDEDFFSPVGADAINRQPHAFLPLSFDGSQTKVVASGEMFCSDPLELTFNAGDYLCLEITCRGSKIPCHPETRLPTFVCDEHGWCYSTEVPTAAMIGCERAVAARVGFVGDSITQGIGAPINSYAHWSALLAEKLGDKYAYWNLGIGCGRANDFATDGVWAYKAKNADCLIVCFGVNDILHGFSEEQIKRDLRSTVDLLRDGGRRVILQTVPPFDYDESHGWLWEAINRYIRTELSTRVDMVFDVVPYLNDDEANPYAATYGGHPNEEGGAVWAQALYEQIKNKGLL